MKVAALRPPRLRTTETEAEERRVTWTELFYDLVFVVAVAGIGERLLHDSSLTGLLAFIGLYVPVWWAWAGFTFYADRYDTDDLGHRLLAVTQMVAIAFMAASISGDETGSSTAFALAYIAARLILIVMYLRARHHVTETRGLVTGYTRGMSAAVLVWLISVFTPPPVRFVLWAIGLAIDFYTPYALRNVQAKVPLDVAHLPERFGLFTILVLGESIAAVVAGLSHLGWTVRGTTTGALAVLLATALWWVYFDNLDGSVVRRRADQKKAWKPTVWIYSHLPLVIAMTATAIGLEHVVAAEPGHALPAFDRWLLIGGVGVALAMLSVIEIATESNIGTRPRAAIVRLRLAGALLALLVGLIGGAVSTTVFMGLAALVCAGQVTGDVLLNSAAGIGRALDQSASVEDDLESEDFGDDDIEDGVGEEDSAQADVEEVAEPVGETE